MPYKYLGQILTCVSQEDFPNNGIWTRCSNPKRTDVNYPKWEVVLGGPDRVTYPASCMTPAYVNYMLK